MRRADHLLGVPTLLAATTRGNAAVADRRLSRRALRLAASETAFAPGVGAEVLERIYRLDR